MTPENYKQDFMLYLETQIQSCRQEESRLIGDCRKAVSYTHLETVRFNNCCYLTAVFRYMPEYRRQHTECAHSQS